MSAKPNTPQPPTPSDSAEPDFAQMERVERTIRSSRQESARCVVATGPALSSDQTTGSGSAMLAPHIGQRVRLGSEGRLCVGARTDDGTVQRFPGGN